MTELSKRKLILIKSLLPGRNLTEIALYFPAAIYKEKSNNSSVAFSTLSYSECCTIIAYYAESDFY